MVVAGVEGLARYGSLALSERIVVLASWSSRASKGQSALRKSAQTTTRPSLASTKCNSNDRADWPRHFANGWPVSGVTRDFAHE
jgi:hypothetical protein